MNPVVLAELRGALAALQQDHPRQARAACERALAIDAGSADAWRLRGLACNALGEREVAVASFARVRALHPDSGLAALELGQALIGGGRPAEALPLLEEAARLLPNDAPALATLGRAHYALGRYRAALAAFEQAQALAPEDTDVLNSLAATRLKRGETAAAVEAAREAVRRKPDSPRLQQTLAAALSWTFERASLEEGLHWAEQVLSARPQHADAHHTASILRRRLGDLPGAIAHARQALGLVPGHPDYALALGEALEQAARPAEAEAVFDQALAAQPEQADLRRQRGIVRLQGGKAASEDLQAAVRLSPGDQRAIAHLGVALAASGELGNAQALVGLDRHIHAFTPPPAEGFADAETFRRQLAEDIRRHSQQRWEPVGLAARQGYLSGDLLADRTPAIIGLERMLRQTIDAFIAGLRADSDDAFLRSIPRPPYRMHVWATRVAEGGNIDTHIHEDSWLSGAYYVELPPVLGEEAGDEYAGWIEFGRPFRHLPPWPETALRRIRPEVGTLLLFPSYLFHRTLPFRGVGERISISFDLAAAAKD